MNSLREYIRELLKEQKVLAQGMCFPFAIEKAEEWFEDHFTKGGPGRKPKRHPDLNNMDKFKVVHGKVTDKWQKPPKPIVHAWVEMGDLVFDDQTKHTKPDGIPKDVYYDMYQPEVVEEFTAEKALMKCMWEGGEGPWNEDLRDIMHQRDAGVNEAGELGRQVFADRAPDGRHYGTERDTEIESTLWQALRGYMGSGTNLFKQDIVDLILQLAQDSQYNDVFIRHTSGDVYRGMAVNYWWLDEHVPEWEDYEKRGKWSEVIPANFELKPKSSSPASSWTTDESMAEMYGKEDGEGQYGVVLIADSSSGDFLDLSELYRYHYLSDYDFEKETIGLGTITVKGIKVYPRPKSRR